MFDADIPGREPDAIFHVAGHHRGLWRLPWVCAATITETEDSLAGEVEVRLWFQPSDAMPSRERLPPRAPAPDRAFDLEAHNAGHAPPEGFWRIHPGLEAYEVEYDPDDGGNWWARLWLNASMAEAAA